MQIIYPQQVDNPMAGIGQGIGVLGNVLGQVITKYRDKTLLDQSMEDAKAKLQAGDPSGMVSLLGKVQTPEYREMLSTQLKLAPQALYQQTEQGTVQPMGVLPAGAKLIEPDKQAAMLRRQQAIEDKKIEGKEKIEALKSEQAEKKMAAQERRQEIKEAAAEARQGRREQFQLFLQDKRFEQQQKLQELKAAGASKKDITTQGRLMLKDYASLKARAKANAIAEKKALKDLATTDPDGYAARMEEIDDNLSTEISELDSAYGDLAPEYGYKLPKASGTSGERKEKQAYDAFNPELKGDNQAKKVVKTGTYNGRKVVQYSDGSVDYAD